MDALEWLVALDDDGDVIRDSLDSLMTYVKSEASRGKFPLEFWVEMRVTANSDVYLSPSVGGKCFINKKYKSSVKS